MDAQHSTAALGLAEAADLAGCSRDTIRRAAQKGDLKAEMGPGVRGPQWWIQESDLRDWLENRDSDAELSSAAQQGFAEHSTAPRQAQHSSTVRSSAPQEAEWSESAPRTAAESFYQVSTAASETPSPPAEVYIALIDRLSRAERRSVELELQLRQSQRLLSENAESITEKEALAQAARAQLQAVEDAKQAEVTRLAAELAEIKEAQARENEAQLKALEEAQKAESARLQAELESTRQQLAEAQKPKGFLSWLGLRKTRTTPASIDKAV
jgi:excisionase family DNA binding protein